MVQERAAERAHEEVVDDLPAKYHANVNVEAPFGGQPGGAPVMDDVDIADIVAFLKTLTDADLVTAR